MTKHYNSKNSHWDYRKIYQVHPEDEERLKQLLEENPGYDPQLVRECWGDEMFDLAEERRELLEVHTLIDLRGNPVVQIIRDQNGELVPNKKYDPERGVLELK